MRQQRPELYDRAIKYHLDKILERVSNNLDGCWLWLGGTDRKGYGQFAFWFESKSYCVWAPRLIYVLLKGHPPSGLLLDHTCRQPLCVNPNHLEPVPNRVNILRGVSPSALNSLKTECAQGHPFDAENTNYSATQRVCRACKRERANV